MSVSPTELLPGWDLDTAPVRREGLKCHELDDEAILYDLAHHALHYLNATAYRIWRSCDGRKPVHELLREIEADYAGQDGADAGLMRTDTLAALGNLAENGLVDHHR